MQIRKLSLEEHRKTRPMYETVFSEDSHGFVDYYYTEKTKDNQIYVVEEDDGIRSMLHLNPYKLSVNGKEKDANYIVAVATEEKYRKRGYMAALIKAALHDMYEAGQSLTFLMPAAESIYLPHDFRTVYEQNLKLYKGKLPDRIGEKIKVTEDGQEYEVSVAEQKDCAELAENANEYLSANYQLFALRDKAYYERLRKEYLSDGGKLMIYRQDGKIMNCGLYVPEEEHTEIMDNNGTEEYAKAAEQAEDTEHKPKIMIRIVDVRRMLMSLSLKSLMAVCFQITDLIIEENNRCVSVTGTEFSGVMLMDGKAENSEGTITIAALSSLIFGAKTIEEVCEEDGVQMSDRMKEEMKKIIPLSQIYLNEIV